MLEHARDQFPTSRAEETVLLPYSWSRPQWRTRGQRLSHDHLPCRHRPTASHIRYTRLDGLDLDQPPPAGLPANECAAAAHAGIGALGLLHLFLNPEFVDLRTCRDCGDAGRRISLLCMPRQPGLRHQASMRFHVPTYRPCDMNPADTSRPQLKTRRINLDTGRENVVLISRRS